LHGYAEHGVAQFHTLGIQQSSFEIYSTHIAIRLKSFIALLFPTRLARISYLIRLLICNLYLFFIIPGILEHRLPECLGLIAIFIYTNWFIILPRLRDTGMSAYWIILTFIPYVGIFFSLALMFRPTAFLSRDLIHKQSQFNGCA